MTIHVEPGLTPPCEVCGVRGCTRQSHPPCPGCRRFGFRHLGPGELGYCPDCGGTGRERPPLAGVVVTTDDGEPDATGG